MSNEKYKYYLVFDNALDSFRFECDEAGNVLSDDAEIHRLVNWCWSQPKDTFDVFGVIEKKLRLPGDAA